MYLSQRCVERCQSISMHSPLTSNKEWSATAPKAADIMVTHGFTGTLNMSQQIDRMGVSELRAPCVTPKAFLWNFAEKRPFTGIDKLIFQCFPVDDMKLTCLSETVASQHVYSPKKKSGTKWSEWDMLVTFVLCWVVLFDGPWLYHLEHVGPKEVHQLAGNVTWCQWQKPFRLFTLLSLLGEPVDPVVKSLHFPIWGYALQVGCRSVPDRDGSMWREEICEGSPETKGSNVTYRLNNSTPCKKDKKYDRFVLSQYAKFSCGMDCKFAKQDWFNTGIHVLCFATIWAQQGVFGVMTSSRMSWDVLTVMPALHPRLGVESGGVHLQLRRPQSQQMALSLGLVLALGSVVLVGATCCLPPCQCFRGRNLHVMIPTLKMGKAKRESNMLSGKVCNCSKDCRKAFTLTTIYNVCCTFWSLNKAAQDCILWGIQNMVESDGSKRGPASRGGSSCSSSSSESSTSEAESASSYSSCDPGKKHVNTWHIQGWLCRRLSLLTLLTMYVCHLLLSMLARIQVFKYAVKLFANCWELEVGGWSVRVGHFKGRICESTVSCLSKVHHTLKYSALCANCLKSDWQFLK